MTAAELRVDIRFLHQFGAAGPKRLERQSPPPLFSRHFLRQEFPANRICIHVRVPDACRSVRRISVGGLPKPFPACADKTPAPRSASCESPLRAACRPLQSRCRRASRRWPPLSAAGAIRSRPSASAARSREILRICGAIPRRYPARLIAASNPAAGTSGRSRRRRLRRSGSRPLRSTTTPARASRQRPHIFNLLPQRTSHNYFAIALSISPGSFGSATLRTFTPFSVTSTMSSMRTPKFSSGI